ncbi:MAG: RNA-dependent DNA polymerase [Candidatus Cloacimonetes bacterium]|nr:RNA-dependent DNA polymerase [Candidatus Cloacimonadota bacterium]
MPKRVGYLYEEIFSWKNLVSAFKKARKSKRGKNEVAEFEYNLEKELQNIQESLLRRTFQFSGYKYFTIQEPKERLISCAPFKDRVVHHAICNILEPIFDRSLIADTYACRKGKGLHHAVRRAFWMYQQSEYVYKFDIKKYFYSIDHEILLQKIKRKIKDPHLIRLLDDLLATYNYNCLSEEYYQPQHFSYRGEGSEGSCRKKNISDDPEIPCLSEEFSDRNSHEESKLYFPFYKRNCGLPIGNLTSQIFANFYLSEFDHYFKEKLHQKYYIRYMDDILVFCNSKSELQKVKQEVEKKLFKIRLHVHPNKNQISKTKHGVNFLGFRFKNNQIRLQNRNLIRFKRKLYIFTSREVSIEDMILSFNGHLGYFNSGHCQKIIRQILNKYQFTDGRKVYKLAI